MKRFLAIFLAWSAFAHALSPPEKSPYQVGAYYFGSFSPSSPHERDGNWWAGVSDKPAIGYYNQQSVATLEKHIRQASDAGLTFFSFYWYWSDRKGGELLPEALQSFLGARNANELKFNLSLYAHPWDDDMALDPAKWDAAIAKLVAYFKDARYLRLPDGRPVFVVGDMRNIRDAGGKKCAEEGCHARATDAFIAALKKRARAAGVEPFVQIQPGPGWYSVKGADGATCLLPDVQVRHAEPYPKLTEKVFAPWIRPGKPVSPCMLQNFDERPRLELATVDRASVRYFVGKTDAAFRGNLEAAKRFSDEAYARDRSPASRIIYLYAWNEWHEGGILEPNAKTGARDLDIVSEVFGLPRAPSKCLDENVCEVSGRVEKP
jgi:glycosyl transferase family WbsX